VATLSDLTDDALAMLRGYVRSQEQATHLAATITASATTFDVADSGRLGLGRAEIGDELVWIDSLSANTLTLPPWGRGVDGTTPATHATGAKVTFNPLFPRWFTQRALRDVTGQVGASIPAVGTYEFTYSPARATYEMPAGTEGVLAVTWDALGPSGTWPRMRAWRLDRYANTTEYPNGVSLTIGDAITPGRTVRVRYSKKPTVFASASSDLTSDVGLPDTCRDLIVLGACARLVASIDAASLDPSSVQAGFSDDRRQPGGAGNVARTLYAMYQERLTEEVSRFRSDNPAPIHFER
jgi:hypothetical protein